MVQLKFIYIYLTHYVIFYPFQYPHSIKQDGAYVTICGYQMISMWYFCWIVIHEEGASQITAKFGLAKLGFYSFNGRRLAGIGFVAINPRRSDDHLRYIMGISLPIRSTDGVLLVNRGHELWTLPTEPLGSWQTLYEMGTIWHQWF